MHWTTIAQKFLKLNGTPIPIGILRHPNMIRRLKLPLCKMLKLTEANRQLKKDKMPSKASCSFSLDFLSEVTPLSLFLLYCLHLLHTLSSCILILLPNFTFSMKFSPLPYPMNLSEPVSLKSSVLRRESEVKVSVTQLCLTLCDPWTVASVHGILQARILEWVTIPISRGSSRPRGQTWVSLMAGRFFTIWATREAYILRIQKLNPSFLICPGLKLSCEL